MKSKNRHHGFTLLEILVALTVLALSMSAVSHSISNSILAFQRIKEATFAQWVALNVVADYHTKPSLPAPGNDDGSEEFGNKEWFWKAKIETTEDPDMMRMRVEVRGNKKDENAAAQVNAFIARPRKPSSIPAAGPNPNSGGGGDGSGGGNGGESNNDPNQDGGADPGNPDPNLNSPQDNFNNGEFVPDLPNEPDNGLLPQPDF